MSDCGVDAALPVAGRLPLPFIGQGGTVTGDLYSGEHGTGRGRHPCESSGDVMSCWRARTPVDNMTTPVLVQKWFRGVAPTGVRT